MGRRKYTMRGQQHGRNMLISEYLWVAYRNSLAPGQEPDMSMKRTRKQVSSHIQVLKGFFTFHRACKATANRHPQNNTRQANDERPRSLLLCQREERKGRQEGCRRERIIQRESCPDSAR